MSNEVGSVAEHAMQHHRQLAGQRHARLFWGRHVLRPPMPSPSDPNRSRQDDVGRLVNRGSHTAIADLRDATAMIGLARLILLRRQSEVRPHRAG
jgi:GAF domain-containing protein